MKINLVLWTSILTLSSSALATTIVFDPEDSASGTFKVVDVEKPVVDCKKEFGPESLPEKVTPKGCILLLKRISKINKKESRLTEFRALAGEGSCAFKKGKTFEARLSKYWRGSGRFTGCRKYPKEHSVAIWAGVLDVWYAYQPGESEKYPEDFEFWTNQESDETPPQPFWSKVIDWFVELNLF